MKFDIKIFLDTLNIVFIKINNLNIVYIKRYNNIKFKIYKYVFV